MGDVGFLNPVVLDEEEPVVAASAQASRIHVPIGVGAVKSLVDPSKGIITVSAHALGVVLSVGMWALVDSHGIFGLERSHKVRIKLIFVNGFIEENRISCLCLWLAVFFRVFID